jgi:hypothetical protein
MLVILITYKLVRLEEQLVQMELGLVGLVIQITYMQLRVLLVLLVLILV